MAEERNKIHVGSLSFNTTDESLRDFFSEVGDVTEGKQNMYYFGFSISRVKRWKTKTIYIPAHQRQRWIFNEFKFLLLGKPSKTSLGSALLYRSPRMYPGGRFSNVPKTFRARKAISKTMKSFMYRAFYVNRFCI